MLSVIGVFAKSNGSVAPSANHPNNVYPVLFISCGSCIFPSYNTYLVSTLISHTLLKDTLYKFLVHCAVKVILSVIGVFAKSNGSVAPSANQPTNV